MTIVFPNYVTGVGAFTTEKWLDKATEEKMNEPLSIVKMVICAKLVNVVLA